MPSADDIRSSPAWLEKTDRDDRAGFRQVFCTLARQKQPAADGASPLCEEYLWLLQDEVTTAADLVPAQLPERLRVFVVGGAFSDCFGEASIAYRRGIDALRDRGLDIATIPISSRSSSQINSGMIASELQTRHLVPADRVILIGYSKGAIDILQFLSDYPDLGTRIDAVVSIAGPVWGSHVAEVGAWAYDSLLAHAFAGRCDPGDGGVVDSLLPEIRQTAMAENPPPAQIRYYSLLAFTTYEHLARGLRLGWRILSPVDRRNDGQVAPAEGTLPGSTLLGYANADHWAVAIDIEEELAFMAKRPEIRHYPREILIEAIIRYIGADLARNPAPTTTPAISSRGRVTP
ncbi:hypothetical protein [Haliea sp. E17]|uniref:hypothetical protein n=1 Tax=Haliea sp. E17 TaxID=3401576 RepID=UPI003AABF082